MDESSFIATLFYVKLDRKKQSTALASYILDGTG